MSLRNLKWAALAAVFAMTQLACYNTYTINNDELSKLEASVDRYEVVEVLADCPDDEVGHQSPGLDGTRFAEAATTEPPAEVEEEVVTDALIKRVDTDDLRGCTKVPVSTVNALTVLTRGGTEQRVTPFNFVMDDVQLVSPEYDVLVQLDQVAGAEVREFSMAKTVAAITTISMLTVGTFVGISVLAPDEEGFN